MMAVSHNNRVIPPYWGDKNRNYSIKYYHKLQINLTHIWIKWKEFSKSSTKVLIFLYTFILDCQNPDSVLVNKNLWFKIFSKKCYFQDIGVLKAVLALTLYGCLLLYIFTISFVVFGRHLSFIVCVQVLKCRSL